MKEQVIYSVDSSGPNLSPTFTTPVTEGEKRGAFKVGVEKQLQRTCRSG